MINQEEYNKAYGIGFAAAKAGLDETVAGGQPLEEAMDDLAEDILQDIAELDEDSPDYSWGLGYCRGILARLD